MRAKLFALIAFVAGLVAVGCGPAPTTKPAAGSDKKADPTTTKPTEAPKKEEPKKEEPKKEEPKKDPGK